MKALEIQDLVLALQGKEYFRVEDIAKELGCSPGDVHRILLKLRVQPGYRWRNKPKTSADYDPCEPE